MITHPKTFDVTVCVTESFSMQIEAESELEAWTKAHETFQHNRHPDRSETDVVVQGETPRVQIAALAVETN